MMVMNAKQVRGAILAGSLLVGLGAMSFLSMALFLGWPLVQLLGPLRSAAAWLGFGVALLALLVLIWVWLLPWATERVSSRLRQLRAQLKQSRRDLDGERSHRRSAEQERDQLRQVQLDYRALERRVWEEYGALFEAELEDEEELDLTASDAVSEMRRAVVALRVQAEQVEQLQATLRETSNRHMQAQATSQAQLLTVEQARDEAISAASAARAQVVEWQAKAASSAPLTYEAILALLDLYRTKGILSVRGAREAIRTNGGMVGREHYDPSRETDPLRSLVQAINGLPSPTANAPLAEAAAPPADAPEATVNTPVPAVNTSPVNSERQRERGREHRRGRARRQPRPRRRKG